IRLLGPLQVSLAGEPVSNFVSDKARALLAYLAIEANKPHRREFLAGLLWPEQPESASRANLRRALTNLRQAIGDHESDPPFLLITRQTVQFNRDSDVWVDVTAFTELQGPDSQSDQLEEAVELYGGGFLEGFSIGDSPTFEEWSLFQREHLNRQVLAALHRLTDHYEALGAHEQALPHAWRRVALDPLREDTHRQVMRLLALSGQRNAALSQYEAMRRILADELDVDPDPESTRLYQEIRSGNLTPPPDQTSGETIVKREARPVGDCPYRGLAAFREEDAPFFFGRDDFIERLAEAVKQRPVVAVIVGSSGSGKSSAVFAGLLPRLRDEAGWLIVHFRPGGHPFHALAGALLATLEPELGETERLIETGKLAMALLDGTVHLHDVVERALEKAVEARRMLLVVDQSEEMYTLCPEPDEQRLFLDAMLSAAAAGSERQISPLVLLITLRADFMGHALAHRPFADALQDSALMMGPMSRAELQLAIEQPAEKQGAAFEIGLVERLLDDVGEEPGNLPLLEFALTLLWEGQIDGWLTHEGYDAIGRVEGALARYADEVFGDLDEEQQETTRRVVEQLVRPGEGTEDTRRVATRAELGDDSWGLVQHLADKRLVVTGLDAAGDEIVEVVHEALIQRWDRLQAWMDADRTFRTWQEGLRAALRGWKAGDHDEEALLRGVALAQAEGWLAERGDELSEAEQLFIRESVALREREQAERESRRRRTVLALTGGLILAVVLAVLAFNARSDANREAETNHSLVLAADAREAFENGETDLALALALVAVDIDEPPPEARRALSSIAQGAGTRAVLEGHSHSVSHAALSPDAKLALSGSCAELDPDGVCSRGELILWDLE
ncbi:MAG: AfsR/SARP family transcriptional regulator, partial [Acidimicrobiia bacterium]